GPPVFMFDPVMPPAFAGLVGPEELCRKAVVITAPVGFGKTVLMTRIHDDLQAKGQTCLWFSLDERDRTVEGVIAALAAALPPGPGRAHPTEALFSDEPADKRIDRCLAPLAGRPPPLTLFIDNLNCCYDPALPHLLNRLLFATPPGVRLVLSSALPLPMDVARARLEGLLAEIGPADLAFRRPEVEQLLGPDLCRVIGDGGIETILARTEGWPAAVRLAGIMLADAPDPLAALAGFSGSDEHLAPLLNTRVLATFGPDTRDFLLCLGQLRHFCLDLCRAAIGETAADDVLTLLITLNLLIIPLDRERRWYRLHGLFRDHLLREGENILSPERRRQIHARAAAWCADRGRWHDAIDYGFTAGDIDLVETVLEAQAARFVRNRGDILGFIQAMERLHDKGRGHGPEASYWYAWALALCRRYDDSRRHADELARRLGSGESGIAARLAMLRVSLDSITDRMRDAHDGAVRWLAGPSAAADLFDGTAANCIVAYHHVAMYRFPDARRALIAAREAAFQSGSAYVQGWAAAYSALVTICEGRLHAAHAELDAALASARTALGDDGGITGTLALMLAKCALEIGREAEARRWLAFGLPTSRTHGFLESAALGLECAVKLGRGLAESGDLSPGALRHVAAAYPPRLSDMLSCFIVRRLIELGEAEAATEEAARTGLSANARMPSRMQADWPAPALMRDLIRITEAELMVAAGRLKQATPRIDADLRQARLDGRAARAVDLALLRCAVATRLQQDDEILRALTLAIRLATPGRLLRPFLAQGRMVAHGIDATGLADWAFPTEDERGFLAEICRRLPQKPAVADRILAAPSLLAPLTPRETELITLMAAGLSNRQMADRVNLSLTTVKWHQQNLYAKLNVTNRHAALAHARALSLLPG
ncbi:MAG: LuxR C-terminal-related transcriptional regulator, partial [Zavarzinia sp.]|nr:LuxR C-terminal-related transcriptional regulator [Zavarzinia sp.]